MIIAFSGALLVIRQELDIIKRHEKAHIINIMPDRSIEYCILVGPD